MRRTATAVCATLVFGTLPGVPVPGGLPGVSGPDPLAAQTPQVVTAVEPDTILVGQPFVLGVTVQVDPETEVRFPSTLPILEDIEQIGIVDIRHEGEGDGVWRAYYRLLAWKPEPAFLPAFQIDYLGSGGSGTAAVNPPAVQVVSVLPDESETLELRPARPFLEGRRFPWWWVALSLLVAWLAWRSMRSRPAAPKEAAAIRLTPTEEALLAIRQLQTEWEAGGVAEVAYFDRLEAILRHYLEVVRGWPPGTVVRAITNGQRPLAAALRRSALVRFGRLEAPDMEILTATRVCSDWIRTEAEAKTAGTGQGGVPKASVT